MTLQSIVTLSLLMLLAAVIPKLSAEEVVYGSQLMTQQEREAHRTRMRNAESEEERDRIRAEHHEQMKSRAREKGMTIPDLPPEQGSSINRAKSQGNNQGYGKGSGQGMPRQ